MGLGMVISGVLGYIQTVAMTHMVSRSTYGVFVVVFTTVVFISQVSKAGQGSVLLRFLPAYRTRREHGLAGGLVRFTVFGPTIIGLVCATLLFLFAAPLSHAFFHSNVYIVPFREAAVIIPLSNLQGMLINGLCAIKAFDWQVYVGKVIEPLATPTLMVIFFLLGLRLEALIFAYIFGILISVVAGWFVFTKAMREITHEVAPVYAPRTWMRFGSAMLFTQMTASLIQSTDVLSLGVFSTASQVSLYRVADRVSSLIDMPFYAITAIFSPTIAELHVRGEHKKLASMYALVTRWAFTLSLPVFLCSIVFSKPILRIFGGGYTAGGAALAILAAGNMINSATGPAGNILAMTGRVRILWFNTALQVSVNLALIFTLVPRYALLGAAMASSLTVIVFNLVAVVEVWWTTKAQPYRWEMVKPVVAGIAASAFGLLLLRVTGLRTRSDVWTLAYTCMLVGAFVVVYALALVRMGLTSDDKMIFAAIRAKFRRA
jgi:O-antigen/teichoic acid export membrane protein